MTRRLGVVLLLGLVMGLVAFACGGGEPEIVEVEKEVVVEKIVEKVVEVETGPVLLGATSYLTGVAKQMGDEMIWGFEQALKEVNDAGGVMGGRRVVVKYYDEGYGAETVVASAKKALSDGIIGMVGGLDATTCVPLKDIMKEKLVPLIATTCGSGKVVKEGFHGSAHATPAQTSDQGVANRSYNDYEFLIAQGGPKVVQVSTDSEYCHLVAADGKKVAAGGFLDELYFPYGAADARVEVTKAAGMDPDGMYFCQWGKQQVVSSIKTARELGFEGPIIVTAYHAPEAKELGSALSKNTFASDSWVPVLDVPENVKFTNNIMENWSDGAVPPWWVETAYTAMRWMTTAIDDAGSTVSSDVADAMYEVSFVTPFGEVLCHENGQRRAPGTYVSTADANGDMQAVSLVALADRTCP